MEIYRPKYIRRGKTIITGGDVGGSLIGGVKEGTGEVQPQWQQWEWHKDAGGGGKRSSSIEVTV